MNNPAEDFDIYEDTGEVQDRLLPRAEPQAVNGGRSVDFLVAATALVNSGFSVVPVKPRSKYPPLTPNGAKNRTKDLAVIVSWAAQFPNANVALCADETFVILESDNEATFRKYIKELTGEELPKTLTSGARPNRPHWIFRRGAVPNGVNLSADGVFELRAHNEYVMGPGSIHPEGHRYQIREDREPALFPKWLFDAVKTMHAAKLGERNAASSFIPPCGAAQIKALVLEAPYLGDYAALIADESVDIQIAPGDRHESLVSLAGSLYSWRIDEDGDRVARDEDEIFDLLCQIRDRFCVASTEKDDEELRRMVRHAVKSGKPCTEPEPNVPCWCDGTTVYATQEAFDNRPNQSAESQCKVDVDLTKFRSTDTGNAERLVARHGDNFRYLHDAKTWLHWDGKRWNQDQTAEIHRAAKDTIHAMHVATSRLDDDMRPKFAKWVAQSESRGARENMVALAQKEPEFSALSSRFDTNPMLLNVLNGTIDLRTFELRPHRREDLLTKRCPVKFNPVATCPRWRCFLNEIFPNQPDVIEFLQRSVGYSLTGETEEQCFWLLIGVGKNGKSKFLDAIQSLLGDYAVATSFDTFAFKKDGAGINPRDGMASLVGSRVVRASESDDGKRLSEAQIKVLTGGERIRTARMYQDDFDYKPTFKIWLSTNHEPVIRGTDEGIWRRVNRVNFNVVISEERRDRQLGAKLETEASGILNWALDGLRQYQSRGLGVPETVVRATTRYRAEQNLVGRFLEDCTEKASDLESVDATALFQSFKNWAKESSEFPLSQTKFGVEAKKLLAHKKTNARFVYLGIKMKNEGIKPPNVAMEAVERSSEGEDCPF